VKTEPESIEDDDEILEEDAEPKMGVVPAAATLLESLERPLKRLGKHAAAKKVRKGARRLRNSTDQINALVGGVASIVSVIRSKEQA